MSFNAWRKAHNAVSLLLFISGSAALGHYFGWWSIEPAVLPAVIAAVVLTGFGFVKVSEKCREAFRREQHEREEDARRTYDDKRRAENDRYARIMSARGKAVEIAQAEYPDHFDEEALADRGWTSLVYGEEIIDAYLDPPDVILKFDVPEEAEQSELRLYDRERVLQMEKDDPTVSREIARVQRDRWNDEEAERRDREREENAAREAAERDNRIAKQKIVNISDKLN